MLRRIISFDLKKWNSSYNANNACPQLQNKFKFLDNSNLLPTYFQYKLNHFKLKQGQGLARQQKWPSKMFHNIQIFKVNNSILSWNCAQFFWHFQQKSLNFKTQLTLIPAFILGSFLMCCEMIILQPGQVEPEQAEPEWYLFQNQQSQLEPLERWEILRGRLQYLQPAKNQRNQCLIKDFW